VQEGGVSIPEPKGLNLKEGEGRQDMRKSDEGDRSNEGFV